MSELPFDKKGTIQSCINKLTQIGYLRIVQERTKGKLGKTLWYVYDAPYPNIRDTAIEPSQRPKMADGSPYPNIRDADNKTPPHPKIPDSGKSTSYKRKNIKKKEDVSAMEGGTHLPEGIYWRRKRRTCAGL